MRQAVIAILFFLMSSTQASAADNVSVLIVVGPSNHPPGSHEVAAGGRLLKHCLEHTGNVTGVTADIVYEWPDQKKREQASTIVFLGDTFPPNRFPNPTANLEDLANMMKRGCGIVCIHYATGLLGKDVSPGGNHPLLQWMGGYFANRSCPHHSSIAKIHEKAVIEPATPDHPISRGWNQFTIHDEPYINNYFGRGGNDPGPGVTPLATSMLPPENPKREVVARSEKRPDEGRGFGIVMPHFYQNWDNDDLRCFVLNGILWTAGKEIPERGVQTSLPDLKKFEPEAVQIPSR